MGTRRSSRIWNGEDWLRSTRSGCALRPTGLRPVNRLSASTHRPEPALRTLSSRADAAPFPTAGHRPIVLAGGADRHDRRPSLHRRAHPHTADTVADWAVDSWAATRRFVACRTTRRTVSVVQKPCRGRARLSAIEFLRDVVKHVLLGQRHLDRDTSRRDWRATAFPTRTIQLHAVAGHDYLELNPGVRLRAAGRWFDQWGNIIAVVRLVRHTAVATVHSLTTPLGDDSEVKKFGQSTCGGSLCLDPDMTSPAYAGYQDFFQHRPMPTSSNTLRWFTFLSRQESGRHRSIDD